MRSKWKSGDRLLGWDAAWTPGGSGAWAVFECQEKGGQCLLLENTPTGREAVEERLQALLQNFQPVGIAVDLPMAIEPVRGYREADRATTCAFSRYGCPVHSPTPERPGVWGDWIREVFRCHGYTLAVHPDFERPALFEVYPHTAAVHMIRASYRLPYKIQRASGYYPTLPPQARKQRVADQLQGMAEAISNWCEGTPDHLQLDPAAPMWVWKAAEDRLDALLCIWAALQAGQGTFLPYGDATAAIWNPDLKGLDAPQRPPVQ